MKVHNLDQLRPVSCSNEMCRLTFLALLIVLALIAGQTEARTRDVRAVPKYTSKYDKVDVDRILASRRLLLAYVACLLEKGPCSPEGRELKKYVPDAIATNCSKCTEIQKAQSGKVFAHMLQYYRAEWDQLLAKYDPDGNFRKNHGYDVDYDYSELDSAK